MNVEQLLLALHRDYKCHAWVPKDGGGRGSRTAERESPVGFWEAANGKRGVKGDGKETRRRAE